MATKADLKLKHQKKAQAYLSGGSAALGIGALGAMAARGKGGAKVAGALNRTGVLGRPVSVPGVQRGATRATERLTVGSVGVGGLSSANFASVQNQESKRIKKSQEISMTTSAWGVDHGAEISKALFPKGPIKRRLVEAGDSISRPPKGEPTYTHHRVTEVGRDDGKLWRSRKNVVSSTRVEAPPGGSSVSRGSLAAGTSTYRQRGGPTTLGAGVGAGAAGAGAGYAAGRKRKKVAKAYDPERSRKRRLDAYSHATAAGAGAAGVVGGTLVARGAKQAKDAKGLPKYKAGLKTAGKGGAVSLGALGAGFAAHRINRYKERGGSSYRPRYISQ